MAILPDHVIVLDESQPGRSAETDAPAKKACLLSPPLTRHRSNDEYNLRKQVTRSRSISVYIDLLGFCSGCNLSELYRSNIVDGMRAVCFTVFC